MAADERTLINHIWTGVSGSSRFPMRSTADISFQLSLFSVMFDGTGKGIVSGTLNKKHLPIKSMKRN